MTSKTQALRIGVMGAGAIGCYVGGRLLAQADVEVTFVGRESLGATIAEHGLTVREFDREQHVGAANVDFSTEVEALSGCDVVLCCVKSGATAEVGASLARVLRPDAIVVSLQNGVRNPETLRQHLPKNRVVPAIVTFNVVIRDHAVFHQTTSGPLIFETGSDPGDEAWVHAVRSTGLEVEEIIPIAPEQWTKLLVNLTNAVGALSGVPTRQVTLSRGYRRVIAMLLDEGLDVVRSAGIRPARFRGLPLRAMAAILKLPTLVVRPVMRAQLRIDPEARSSMWQDLEGGRLTEVDFLNGEIVRLAEAHSRDAPFNRRIAELVHQAEHAAAGSPNLEARALLTELQTAAR